MRSMKALSDLQMAVMRVLWRRGRATAAEVQAELAAERRLALTTVATVLSRLERQGLLEHQVIGRKFHFQPRVSEQAVRRSMVAELIDRVFRGDPTALVNHLMAENEISAEELEQIRRLLGPQSDAGEPEDGDAD
jgi:predicted transcriptional regulator